jgi:hypothetical protein
MSFEDDPTPWKEVASPRRSGQPPYSSGESPAGWWGALTMAVIFAWLMLSVLPWQHWPRILSVTGPTAVAAILGVVFASRVRLLVRLAWLASAVALGVAAFFLVPTTTGINHVMAQERLDALTALPRKPAEFRERLDSARQAAKNFPSFRPAVEVAVEKWGYMVVKDLQMVEPLLRKGKVDAAGDLLASVERDVKEIGFSDSAMLKQMRDARDSISSHRLVEVILPRIESLPGNDVAEYRRLRTEFDKLTRNQHHHLEVRFRDASAGWADRAATAGSQEADRLARKDDLAGARAVLARVANDLDSVRMKNEGVRRTLGSAGTVAVDTVWKKRLDELLDVPVGDAATYRKQRTRCQEVTAVAPEKQVELDMVESQWLDFCAAAAIKRADPLIRDGKLDDAERLLQASGKELAELGKGTSTSAEKTLRQGRKTILQGRLAKATTELKSLQDARDLAGVAKLARQSAQLWKTEAETIGAEAELLAFLANCIGVAIAEDCRGVDALLGKEDLKGAAERMRQIAADRAELLLLVRGGDEVGEYRACRRRVAQAHLDEAKRALASLQTQKKGTEAARRAARLLEEWEKEFKAVELDKEMRALLTGTAETCLRAGIAEATAELKRKEIDTALGRLDAVGREWEKAVLAPERLQAGPRPLNAILTEARRQAATAALADARTRLIALVEAEDYAGLEKLSALLAAKKELPDWGMDLEVRAFLERCEFLLTVARSAGKLSKGAK